MGLDQPSWQGIGAIISLIGVLITLLVFWLQLPKRRIIYSISAPRPVLLESNVAIHSLQIVRNGVVITNPTVVIIRIKNAGRGEVDKSDYSEPIRIDFGANATLHSAAHYRSHPSDLPIAIQQEAHALTIEPLLLNRRDSFEFQCLVGSSAGEPKVTGRIRGVTQLTKVSEEEFYSGRLRAVAQGYAGLALRLTVVAFLVFSILDSLQLARKFAPEVARQLMTR